MDTPFRGTFDRHTLHQAVLLASRPTRVQLIIRVIVAVIFLALLVGIAIEIAGQVFQGQVDSARVLRGVISLALLGYVVARPLMLPHQVTAAMWKDADMHIEQSGFVNEAGVTYVKTSAQTEIGWEKYSRLYRTPDLVALVTSDGRLSALPRTFFASDDDWTHFNQLIGEKVKLAV